MPDKRVRWANANELYYSSPNHSPVSSSTGSPMSPLPTIPLPDAISLNETLRFKRDLGFTVDFREDPTKGGALDVEKLDESATIPAVSHISIASSKLPFTIHIGEPKEGRGITVGDLLRRLHLALRETVTDGELQKEKSEDRKAILKTFEERCEALKEHNVADSVHEKEAGLRRIDYLRGRNTFAGFEVVMKEHPTLRLHVKQ